MARTVEKILNTSFGAGNSDISIQLISKKFEIERAGTRTETKVLDEVTFDVPSGAFVSVVGPSGSGKTTLLRIVAGAAKADSGQVRVGRNVVTGPGPDRAVVFQSGTLLPWRSVLRNVTYGLEMRGMKVREATPVAEHWLGRVGLSKFAAHYPAELSGGMQQRVNLARALALDPDALLMDEPFAALDAQTRELMQADLLQIWGEGRKTVLFITHQIDEAVFLSDIVIVLNGRPAKVVDVVPINLPRPRSLELKQSPEFGPIVNRIWEGIKEQALNEFRREFGQDI